MDIDTVEEYIEEALEGKYDTEYYNSIPSISDLLQVYLEKNKDKFISIILQ